LQTVELLASSAVRNTPNALPPNIPDVLAQGKTDELVRPAVTEAYMVVQARSNGWRTVLRAHPYRPTAARGLSSAKSLLLAILQFACPRALS